MLETDLGRGTQLVDQKEFFVFDCIICFLLINFSLASLDQEGDVLVHAAYLCNFRLLESHR